MDFSSELNKLENLDGINVQLDATMADGQKAKDIFCKSWPIAKVVLEALSKMTFPVGAIIAIVIKLGDGIYNKHCG